MTKILMKGLPVDVKVFSSLALAHSLDQYLSANLCPLFHARVHLGASSAGLPGPFAQVRVVSVQPWVGSREGGAGGISIS